MLVLSRKVGERIRIGEDIWITVLKVDGMYNSAMVRIGLDCPKSIKITREDRKHHGKDKKNNWMPKGLE
jgi:carbon storage regulator